MAGFSEERSIRGRLSLWFKVAIPGRPKNVGPGIGKLGFVCVLRTEGREEGSFPGIKTNETCRLHG